MATPTQASGATTFCVPAKDMTDENLLLEYRRSADQACFSELVRRYESQLYAYLYGRFADATLVEDALQTTFLHVHVRSDQFDEGRKVRPWLYRIAMNSAIDIVRRNRRHQTASLNTLLGEHIGSDGQLLDTLTSHGPGPSERIDRHEEAAQCRTAVTRLPDRLKSVVDLVFFKGLKYRDAAEVLSIPVGTVKSRLHEAVAKLRVRWMQSSAL